MDEIIIAFFIFGLIFTLSYYAEYCHSWCDENKDAMYLLLRNNFFILWAFWFSLLLFSTYLIFSFLWLGFESENLKGSNLVFFGIPLFIVALNNATIRKNINHWGKGEKFSLRRLSNLIYFNLFLVLVVVVRMVYILV